MDERERERERKRSITWFETSEWSQRVRPSPMALFMRRDRDGRTLIGG
jgi:hypothetical protein